MIRRSFRPGALIPSFAVVGLLFVGGCGDKKGSGDEGPYPCTPGIQSRPVLADGDNTFPVGPSMMHVTETSAWFMWETETECDGEIRYGVSGSGSLDRTTGSDREGTIHKARLSGLEPDTQYDYQVSACGLTTSVLSFWTAPPRGTPVRFVVWGDSRTHPDRCLSAVEGLIDHGLHFSLHTGDVVTHGETREEWPVEYFEPIRVLGHHFPTYVAIGNHEGNHSNFYAYMDFPYPETLTDHRMFGSNYSFVYGNVFVLTVDTNNAYLLLSATGEPTAISEWIQETITSDEAQRATWRIAMGHHPGYSECGHAGAPVVSTWLMPMLSENGFHAYFAGHTHDYERGRAHGMLHIITGGGGASLYTDCHEDLPETEVVVADYHYTLVEAECDRMTLTTLHVPDATTMDEVTIYADR